MLLKKLFKKKEYYYLFTYQVLVDNRFINGETIYKLPIKNEKKIDIQEIRLDIAKEIESRNNKNVECIVITSFKKLDWR